MKSSHGTFQTDFFVTNSSFDLFTQKIFFLLKILYDTQPLHFTKSTNVSFFIEPPKLLVFLQKTLRLTPFKSNFIYYATSLNGHIRVNTLLVSKILLIIQFNIYSPSINRVEKSQKPENEPA